MADFREVREAEANAQSVAMEAMEHAAAANTPLLQMFAQIRMLDAIRLEIRAQGMRFDYSMTEAAKS